MKSIFLIKVLISASVLFGLALLMKYSALIGQGTELTYALEEKSGNIYVRPATSVFPERDEWQKPEEVLKSLHLKPGDVIADIGAGDGYFTKRFAKAVSPGGEALGLEVTSSKVAFMKQDAERLGLKNYKALLVDPNDPGLEPGSVDVVFLCNTYHHLSNRVEYLKSLSKSLKKNGRVVIIDFYKKQMSIGPPPDHKLAREIVLEEFREAGYSLKAEKDLLAYQYFLEFGLR